MEILDFGQSIAFKTIKNKFRIKNNGILKKNKKKDIEKDIYLVSSFFYRSKLQTDIKHFFTNIFPHGKDAVDNLYFKYKKTWKKYGEIPDSYVRNINDILNDPFFEEFLFRGFLIEGLSRSKVGVIGAVILTSASWAIIHMQYGWFEIISIFFIGIVLCIAKIKSKSLYVPIAMHMLMNLVASIGMELSQ